MSLSRNPLARVKCIVIFAAPSAQNLSVETSCTGIGFPISLNLTILPELEAQILRYYHIEKWRTGTIAGQLGVHHGTVTRVLAQAGLPQLYAPRRASAITPYLPFILETLEKFSTLTASRLYAMVHSRGYSGSPDHFRHLIALHRPRPKAEAYLRLRTLPGEQAQVDWGHFGRPCPKGADGFCDGAVLVTDDLSAVFSRCSHGELPAWTRRSLCRLRWCA
jgi:hypothetical protein